jgi:hypothetical protein
MVPFSDAMFVWTRKDKGFTAGVGPFVANVMPKGDGRWSWEVYADEARSPQATGVASSAGAAKATAEQLIKRSGRV